MKVGPDMVGLWLWPLAALYVLRIVKGGDPRLWLGAGAAIGVSLESKYSVIFFALALLAGLALTSAAPRALVAVVLCGRGARRRASRCRTSIWQAVHGFPMWELLRNGQNGKNLVARPQLYLFQQLLLTNLFLSPIWIVGLVWLLGNRAARFLGYAYVVLTILMIALRRKALLCRRRLSDPDRRRRGRRSKPGRVSAFGCKPRLVRSRHRGRPLLPAVLAAGALGTGDAALRGVRRRRAARQASDDADRALQDLGASRGLGRHARLARARRDRRADLQRVTARGTTPGGDRREQLRRGSRDRFLRQTVRPAAGALRTQQLLALGNARLYSGNVIIDVNGDCGAASHPGSFAPRVSPRAPIRPG